MTTKLETRIREVAAKMEGSYDTMYVVSGENVCFHVPHSVFVTWDATWDVAEEIDPEDDSPCNEDSSDEEIEACIRYRESVCDECYEDEIQEFCRCVTECARDLARDMKNQCPGFHPDDKELLGKCLDLLGNEKKLMELASQASTLANFFMYDAGERAIKMPRPDYYKLIKALWGKDSWDYIGAEEMLEGSLEVNDLEHAVEKCVLSTLQAWFRDRSESGYSVRV